MANSKCTYIILCVALWLCTACTPAEPTTPNMVVEGWIDADGHPVVILHRSYPVNDIDTAYHSIEDIMKDYLIMFGKVTISDGTDSVVLTGRLAPDYMPPYIYTSVFMTGTEGHSYTLTAEYRGLRATATTTIPPRAAFDSICVTKVDTGRFNIVGHIHTSPPDARYVVFAKYSHQQQYRLCPLGAVTAPSQGGPVAINIFDPNYSDNPLDQIYWKHNDTTALNIKLARVDEKEYRFWDSFASSSISAGTFYLPVRQNIESNIVGGIGYWCGMGATEYTLLLNREQTYRYPSKDYE